MIKEAIIAINESNGLHARPAAELAAMAKRYKSNITLTAGSKVANAKSVISLLTLGVKQGSEINLKIEGEDSEDAMHEVTTFFEKMCQ